MFLFNVLSPLATRAFTPFLRAGPSIFRSVHFEDGEGDGALRIRRPDA
jgi:hypothetical protein